MSAPRFSPGGYIPVICACIRDHADPAVIAVPDPTCPRHAPQVRQGIEPTFVIYDETVQADRAAHHTATGLGRLLRWTARLLLAAVLLWIFATDTPDMTGWHWAAGIAATPLALIAMPVPKEKP